MKKQTLLITFLLIVAAFSCLPTTVSGFAILTHEAVIDASWDKSIVPLLKKKFPKTSEEDLKKAKSFAYGGSLMPDIGYAPLGSGFFSNLVHYVRTGDLVTNLITEAKTVNEYAFALGFLCHYEADIHGHSLGTNKAVPILFPKKKKKYGDEVTYEEGKINHGQVEFGFDVFQVVQGKYKPESYNGFIGFGVSDSLLDRALIKTYGLELKDIFNNFKLSVNTFRYTVKALIPQLTKVAWKNKNTIISKLNPLATKKNFQYKVDKKKYNKDFERPSVTTLFLMLFVGVLPKYGPTARFNPKIPNEEAEKLFSKSFETIQNSYNSHLDKIKSDEIKFENKNLDTGDKTAMNKYKLADKTYYDLLMKLEKKKFDKASKSLKAHLTSYFKDQNETKDYNKNKKKGKKIASALAEINAKE